VKTIRNLDSYILREVGMLARSIQSTSDVKFKEINLQRGQFVFLTRICEHPGINQIDLSSLVKVDKTTTTKAIQKLIDEGYVAKERDEKDGRMWRLYATDEAKRVYPIIIDEENRNIALCFCGFSENQKQLVYNLVKKMRENIEAEWKTLRYSEVIIHD
jgi:DNA-binding MarR family transcriptional regulator